MPQVQAPALQTFITVADLKRILSLNAGKPLPPGVSREIQSGYVTVPFREGSPRPHYQVLIEQGEQGTNRQEEPMLSVELTETLPNKQDERVSVLKYNPNVSSLEFRFKNSFWKQPSSKCSTQVYLPKDEQDLPEELYLSGFGSDLATEFYIASRKVLLSIPKVS